MTQQYQPSIAQVSNDIVRRCRNVTSRRPVATGLVIGGLVLGGGPAMITTAVGESYRNPFVREQTKPSSEIRQTGYGVDPPTHGAAAYRAAALGASNHAASSDGASSDGASTDRTPGVANHHAARVDVAEDRSRRGLIVQPQTPGDATPVFSTTPASSRLAPNAASTRTVASPMAAARLGQPFTPFGEEAKEKKEKIAESSHQVSSQQVSSQQVSSHQVSSHQVSSHQVSGHQAPVGRVPTGPPPSAFEAFVPGQTDRRGTGWSMDRTIRTPKRLPRTGRTTKTVSAPMASEKTVPNKRFAHTRPAGSMSAAQPPQAYRSKRKQPAAPAQTALAEALTSDSAKHSGTNGPNFSTKVYLASQTTTTLLRTAREHRQRAELEYRCRAYASAEASCWQSLRSAAQAIDANGDVKGISAVAGPSRTAIDEPAVRFLERGHTAIMEAADFAGPYAGDPLAVARLARAHTTPVIRQNLPAIAESSLTQRNLPTATEAIDRYLDYGRSQLAVVASASVDAAVVMDLLAAIRLDRADATQLPGPTSLCLRRAAVQGQSGHALLTKRLGFQLADAGLIDEARRTLRQSFTASGDPAVGRRLAQLQQREAAPSTRLVTRPDPLARARAETEPQRMSSPGSPTTTRRTPEVVALDPQSFAAISQSVIRSNPQAAGKTIAGKTIAGTNDSQASFRGRTSAQAVSFRMNTESENSTARPKSSVDHEEAESERRFGSRFLSLFRKWW